MKKILSLVLAVAMLSSVAFAAVIPPDTGAGKTNVNPGTTLTVDENDFTDGETSPKTLASYFGSTAGKTDVSFTSTNFTVTKKTFDKGAALVTSVAFNDDEEVIEIKLKQDYELSNPALDKAANVIIGDLVVSAKKNLKDATNDKSVVIARSKKFTYDGTSKIWVGYAKQVQAIDDGIAEYENGKQIEFGDEKNATGTVTRKSEAYGIATLNDGGDISIEGRVYKGDKVYLEVNSKIGDDQEAMLKKYENADLNFYNVITSGLSSNHDIWLSADEEMFVYEIVDGQLAASGLKWNADDYAFKGKIRSDKKYVVSDIELKVSASAGGSENPDTGANDVVGVAAALAIVSVVAAAAVSLKK